MVIYIIYNTVERSYQILLYHVILLIKNALVGIFGSGARPPQTDIGSIARNTNGHKDYQPHRVNVRNIVCN